MNWIKDNTNLEIIGTDIYIKPKGYFKNSKNLGDIDILLVDKANNTIYSIECKNTIQSKTPYEFKMELDNYIGTESKKGQILKHLNRNMWLIENIDLVKTKLSLTGNYKIKSIIVTKNIIPKIQSLPLEIFSYLELTQNKIF